MIVLAWLAFCALAYFVVKAVIGLTTIGLIALAFLIGMSAFALARRL